MADYLNIAGRVRTTAADGVAVEAQEIKDLQLDKNQQEINADVQTELSDRYTKEETYSQEQLNSLITTPDVEYVNVVATDQTTDVTDVLPATGSSDTIYRVANWDGTQYDTTKYSLYAWNGTAYVCLAVRSFAGEIYDISANHPDGHGNPTVYNDLADALGTSGANVPSGIRRGGMTVKFIQLTAPAQYSVAVTEGLTEQPTGTELLSDPDVTSGTYTADQLTAFSTLPTSTGAGNAVTYWLEVSGDTTTYTTYVITLVQVSDNKYVQYRLVSEEFGTTASDWQGVDEHPVAGSANLVESNGVAMAIADLGISRDFIKTIATSGTNVVNYTFKKGYEYSIQSLTGHNSSFGSLYLCKDGTNNTSAGNIVQTLATNWGGGILTFTAEDDGLGINGWWSAGTVKLRIFGGALDDINRRIDEKASIIYFVGAATPLFSYGSNNSLIITLPAVNMVFENDRGQYSVFDCSLLVSRDFTLVSYKKLVYDFDNETVSVKDMDAVGNFYVLLSFCGTPIVNAAIDGGLAGYYYKWLNNTTKSGLQTNIDNANVEIEKIQSSNSQTSFDSVLNTFYPSNSVNGKSVNTIYLGNVQMTPSYNCIADSTFYKVEGGSVLYVISRSGINVKVAEYSTNSTSGYIKETGYSTLTKITLDVNTKYVRIAGQYSGFSSDNHITLNDYSVGDFYIKIIESRRIIEIENIIGDLQIEDAQLSEILKLYYPSMVSPKMVGTIWEGQLNPSSISTICDPNYYEVNGGSVLNIHKGTYNGEPITIRISEYSDKNQSSYIKQTGYSNIESITLDSTTKYVRISAQYPGFSSENPISIEDYTEGDFYLILLASERLDKLEDKTFSFEDAVTNQLDFAKQLGFGRLSRWEGDYLPEGWIPQLVFLHVSDVHGSVQSANNAITILNRLSTRENNLGCCAKFLINTGDIKLTDYNSDYSYWNNAIDNANKPVFHLAGNHDCGQAKVISGSATDAQIYALMVEPYLTDWDLTTANEGTPHPSGKNYFFKDFYDEKIRLIVLYEYESNFEVDSQDNTKYKYRRDYRSFSQAQIDWLIDSLMTTPSDYGVIIAKHQQEDVAGSDDIAFNAFFARGTYTTAFTYVSTSLIADIVDAFINSTSINQSYSRSNFDTPLSVVADFSNKNEGNEFICYLSGHTHFDTIHHLKNYPNQIELTIGCNNTNYTHGSDMSQVSGEKSESVINVCSIDRNRGYIYVVRIGSDMSYNLQHRDFIALDYRSM